MILLTTYSTWVVVAVLAAAGCAPLFENRPAILAVRNAAVAIAAGVRVTAEPAAWRGERLGGRLRPVQITLENESGRPLRIGYRDFTLVTGDGQRLGALPVFDLELNDPRVPSRYAYPWSGFHLAPHLIAFYRGFWTGGWTFGHDPRLYELRYRTLRAEMAPTVDMQRRALPEGVLEPGGSITGLLYFSAPATATTLTAILVDATSTESFGSIEIPLITRG